MGHCELDLLGGDECYSINEHSGSIEVSKCNALVPVKQRAYAWRKGMDCWGESGQNNNVPHSEVYFRQHCTPEITSPGCLNLLFQFEQIQQNSLTQTLGTGKTLLM